MRELLPGVWHFNEETELIESPDDDGWYFQQYPSHETSRTFPTKDAAINAWPDVGWGEE